MKVIMAQAAGVCFGVEDALATTAGITNPQAVTIHGELVHNPLVQNRLRDRGFLVNSEDSRAAAPTSAQVLITAHGISNRERLRLTSAGKQLIDTTCPLVRRAHDAALSLAREGRFVIVLGKASHVEVEGLTGDLDAFAVVNAPADVRPYPSTKLGIVCQTTLPTREAQMLRGAIAAANPHADIRFVDTICRPTKDRQRALEDILRQADAVVVVGGRHSNNTRKLLDRCAEAGRRAWHVESAADLRRDWFLGCDVVGLTGGTSTLPETLREVHDTLLSIAAECQTAPQFATVGASQWGAG